MMFIADFSKSIFCSRKAFNPKIVSSIQPAALFETNPASISSKMVEFGTFDCVIALPEYVIAKFPAELHENFSAHKCAAYQVITWKIVNFHQWPDVFHRWTTDGH